MTDFDQLIKAKGEQAQYKYNASAWRRFLKHSGFKVGLSGMQIAAVAITAVVVAGGAVFAILKTHAPETPNAQNPIEIVAADTTSPQTTDLELASDEAARVTTPSDVQNVVRKVETPTTESQSDTIIPSNTSSSKPKTHQTESHPRLVPVRINVDTITQLEATEEEQRNGNSRLY